MSKVVDAIELKTAIDKAFAVDNQVLVEEMIVGREFTVGVFKNKGEIMVLPITEIITDNEFFDYEAKYLGKSKEVTPADISIDIERQLADDAKKVYELLNCSGVVRIDFIYNEAHQKAFMLEVNTVPGQSQASIIPQQVLAMGWTLEKFYTATIENVLP
jgi:D-alanine-D-alanine ligase